MNKKKAISLLIAGALTTGMVGGTLAWFTSQDNVTNTFKTVQNNSKNQNGLDICEYLDVKAAASARPGHAVEKKVQVKNTASYAQFIRVKLTPKWIKTPNLKDSKGNYMKATDSLIGVNTTATNFEAKYKVQPGKWYKHGDYYYYIGSVAPGKCTTLLLNSVEISGKADNKYQGADYSVLVQAYSIQSDKGAGWDGAPGAINKAMVDKKGNAIDKSVNKEWDTMETGSETNGNKIRFWNIK